MMDEPEGAEADNKTKMAFAKMQAPQALRDACVLTDADFETIRDDNSEEGEGPGMDPDQSEGLFLGGDLSLVSAPGAGGEDGGGSFLREGSAVATDLAVAPAPPAPGAGDKSARREGKKKGSVSSPPTGAGTRKRVGVHRPDSPGSENEVNRAHSAADKKRSEALPSTSKTLPRCVF